LVCFRFVSAIVCFPIASAKLQPFSLPTKFFGKNF